MQMNVETESNSEVMKSNVEATRLKQIPFDSDMIDVMNGCSRWTIDINNEGSVALVDVMPRLAPKGTADYAIVQAARVSYGDGTRHINEDNGLIRYLARHKHTTPFEMIEFKFHCIMPIFVARQWIRHRTANVNEYSARYSVVKDRYYKPDISDVRAQSQTNKQEGSGCVDHATAQGFLDYLEESQELHQKYLDLLNRGVCREQARIGLPINLYTEWYWKIDLHNLFRFLSLRMTAHAQLEIRQYACAMYDLIKPIVPLACAAFEDFDFNSITLSSLEIDALKNSSPLQTTNKGELSDWSRKQQKLGLVDSSLL